MKPLFTLIIMVATMNVSSATVYTLCNMPYSPGQFTTFADAQNFASDGDTIYVHGSNFSYGNISIFKALVLIGTGHHPNKQAPLVASFGNINIAINNAQLIGLTFNTLVSLSGNGTVKRCRLLGTPNSDAMDIYGYDWLIEGNIFDYQSTELCIYFANSGRQIVQHNIFATLGPKIDYIEPVNSADRSYILNNVFLGDPTLPYIAFFNLHYVTIRDNIFYGSSPYYDGAPILNCIIEKNITYQGRDNNFYPTATYGPLNQVGVDPMFNNFPGFPSNLFLYTHDFTLSPVSPGHNYGSDGTDVGVFGGLGELFTMTGEPSIAEITAFTVTSPTTISPGGTLTISVTSKRVH